MASAREWLITPVKPVRNIVLTLSEDEAQIIKSMCQKVGGSPSSTYRNLTAVIGDALAPLVGDQDADKFFQHGYSLTARTR